MIECILFDMDGTIVDTEPTAAATVTSVFAEWGTTILPEDSEYVTGRTWESCFQYLFSKYTIPIPHDQAKRHIMDQYRAAIEKKLPTVPGSVEAIQSLARFYPLGLVSGSMRREILWVLNKLKVTSCFQIILGAEDYPRSKPSPDGYIKAMEYLRKPPQACLVFEDSTAGIASGLAAGAWVAAITCTNHFKQVTSGAHIHIPDLTGVTQKWMSELPLPST